MIMSKSEESENLLTHTTLKVDVDKIDTIMDLCGELVVIKSQIQQYPALAETLNDPSFSALFGLLGTTVRDIYQRAMSMRLVSIKPTLLKLERAIEDVAQRLNKEVEFDVTGENLELDRSILDQISDPLLHLCRNAVSHGIEQPNTRRSMGKLRSGKIELKVSCEGAKAIIDIVDDGAGISRTRVIEKAKSLGLVSPSSSVTSINDQEIFELLFKPGFSTAATVGDISGRGVGLDVVRTCLRNLRGDIQVHSEDGKGSTFRLTVPLSSALTDCIETLVGDQVYLFPLNSINEFVSIGTDDVQSIVSAGNVYRLREDYVPVFFLSEVFSLGQRSKNGVALIVRSESGILALVVDQVLRQSQVVVKKVDDAYHGNDLVSGAAVMGDGKIALVVDTTSSNWKNLGVAHGRTA
jgi:two-component system chemotaxis sensor kinase CheA